jgi:hypothetical protein
VLHYKVRQEEVKNGIGGPQLTSVGAENKFSVSHFKFLICHVLKLKDESDRGPSGQSIRSSNQITPARTPRGEQFTGKDFSGRPLNGRASFTK